MDGSLGPGAGNSKSPVPLVEKVDEPEDDINNQNVVTNTNATEATEEEDEDTELSRDIRRQSLTHSRSTVVKAAEKGHAEARYNLAVRYESGEGIEIDLIRAVDLYEKSAKQGWVSAQVNLSNLYKSFLAMFSRNMNFHLFNSSRFKTTFQATMRFHIFSSSIF